MKAALNPRNELDQLLKLYFQLLDLSLDVERNREDYVFQEEGGTIWYVFDENILELFIDPRDHRGRITSLHGVEWSPADRRSAAKAYVAQTTLATAEYLLSGDLPGQSGDSIYMTEWHRWEFTNRVEQLQLKQVALLRGATRDQVLDRFAPLGKALSLLSRDPDGFEATLKDRRLASDLRSYRARNPSLDSLKAYFATRSSLDILANDEIVEPSEQLRRLVTPPLRHVFTTLHRALPAASPEEKRAIAKDAQEWMGRLRDECARRKIDVVARDHRVERPRTRAEGALWDDAKSLALVRWAASQKSRTSLDQRLVFVTADQVVFDAYRRWYADLPLRDQAYAESFCLRRMTQFAPVFNLVSSGRVEEGAGYVELFQDLLQALEVMLLPLNLSRIASQAPAPVLSRMRERTALRPGDPGSVVEDPAYYPLVAALRQRGVSTCRAELDVVIDRWRELERAALGRPDEQLQRRIDAAATLGTDLSPADSAEAFEKYVTDLVRTLLSGSRKLSLPLAREFIEEWTVQSTLEVVRAPIALSLSVTIPNGRFDVAELLERRTGDEPHELDEEAWQALYEHAALLFAIAAAKCLIARDWSNAYHFAEMALVEEAETDDSAAGVDLELGPEIKYLYALVNRFRIAEIGPPLTGDAFGRIERHYRLALTNLDECEAFHACRGDSHPLRRLRTLSERSALHLFFAAAVNSRVRKTAAMRRGRGRGSPAEVDLLDLQADAAAIEAVEAAEGDIAVCLALDAELEEVEESRWVDFRSRVQRQLFTNVAAAAVYRALWHLSPDGAPSSLRANAPPARAKVREIIDRYGNAAHPLMRALVAAFLTLGGDKDAAEALKRLPRDDRRQGALNFDLAVVETLRSAADELAPAAAQPPADLPGEERARAAPIG